MLFFTYLFTYFSNNLYVFYVQSLLAFFVICAFTLTHSAKISQIIQIKGVKPKQKVNFSKRKA